LEVSLARNLMSDDEEALVEGLIRAVRQAIGESLSIIVVFWTVLSGSHEQVRLGEICLRSLAGGSRSVASSDAGRWLGLGTMSWTR